MINHELADNESANVIPESRTIMRIIWRLLSAL
jgi:hypothetical protein